MTDDTTFRIAGDDTLDVPATRMTGRAWIDHLATGIAPSCVKLVKGFYEPGARTVWHKHLLGQILHAVDGNLVLQERGRPSRLIRPGETAACAPGTWHWHGSDATHFNTHITVIEMPQDRARRQSGPTPSAMTSTQPPNELPRTATPSCEPRAGASRGTPAGGSTSSRPPCSAVTTRRMLTVNRLNGKIAVVTGSSLGIGAAIVRAFADEGAHVVIDHVSGARQANDMVNQIRAAGGKALAVEADMSHEADVARLFSEAHAAFGQLDVLVNNAGVYEFAPLQDLTLEHFRRQFELNVLGYLRATREALQYFPSSGASVVNIGSTVTSLGPVEASVYTATKAAVDGLTRALSNELAPRGVRVNCIKAGVIDTEGLRASGFLESDYSAQLISQTPLGRHGVPEDVASAAVYLASSESSWITGEAIVVSGGNR